MGPGLSVQSHVHILIVYFKNNMNNKFDFIYSTRFYALVLGSASTVLVTSFGTEPWYISLGKFLGLVSAGFITIRTIDRNTGDAQPNITLSELKENE